MPLNDNNNSIDNYNNALQQSDQTPASIVFKLSLRSHSIPKEGKG